MAEITPADAALEGFRFTREHPAGIGIWAILFFIASLLTNYLLVRTGALDAAADLSALGANTAPDPAVSLEIMGRFFPSMGLSLAPVLLMQVLIQAGILRIALRPGQGRAYVGLGADEVRVLGASLLLMLLVSATVFGVILVSVFLTMAAPALGIMGVLLGTLAVYVFLNTRLCLLAPLAVAEGSLKVGEAWRLTQGRFWRVLGTLMLAFIFMLIVLVLGLVVSSAVRAATGIDLTNSEVSMARLFHPGEIAASAVEAVLQAMGLVLITAPLAAIYRSLKPRVADVF